MNNPENHNIAPSVFVRSTRKKMETTNSTTGNGAAAKAAPRRMNVVFFLVCGAAFSVFFSEARSGLYRFSESIAETKAFVRSATATAANLLGDEDDDEGKEESFFAQRQAQKQQEQPPPPPVAVSHPQWCPLATCNTTELCAPCRRRFLIIITAGRSASTTLTWMLDKLPGLRMAGENNDALGNIKAMFDNVPGDRRFKKNNDSWKHNYIPPQSMSCVAQSMIEAINPPLLDEEEGKTIADKDHASDIIGFKTIRFFYHRYREEQQDSMAQFLIDNFPCSKVLINVNSDVEGQAASIEKNFKRDGGSEKIRHDIVRENDMMSRLSKTLGPERSFVLDKTVWTADNLTSLNAAVSWLGYGEPCHFKEMLAYNAGGYRAAKSDLSTTSNDDDAGECRRI